MTIFFLTNTFPNNWIIFPVLSKYFLSSFKNYLTKDSHILKIKDSSSFKMFFFFSRYIQNIVNKFKNLLFQVLKLFVPTDWSSGPLRADKNIMTVLIMEKIDSWKFSQKHRDSWICEVICLTEIVTPRPKPGLTWAL